MSPDLAVLDETDSGLDIDAKIVANGVINEPTNATIVITHYQRLLDYIVPDFVHVLFDGTMQNQEERLAIELEEKGYIGLKRKSYGRVKAFEQFS